MLKETSNPDIDKILDNLYLGDYWGAYDKLYLQKLNITKIIICGNGLRNFYPNDFQYKMIDIQDKSQENINKYFMECINFIEESENIMNENIYVHCHFGISRSPTIVIAYIMWKMNLCYDEAFKFVKSKRSKICPNNGFILQLKNFENEINSK